LTDKKTKLRKLLIILLVILVFVFLFMIIKDKHDEKRVRELIEHIQSIPRTQSTDSGGNYVSPIDFRELKKINPDIYAWVEIPDTNVNLPVLQHRKDNAYYMHRNINGDRASGGSLYTEDYNSLTFEDRVTVIYGHNMKNRTMFGELKKYSDGEFFKNHGKMTVYLADCEKHYELVGAIPFDDRHIMHSYDFYLEKDFESLVYDILHTRNINSRYAENAKIKNDDKLVILSTCYFNNRSMRFLVVWKEIRSDEK